MGTVYNRGTRHKARWWVTYKEADGTRQWTASHQPTKAQARKYLEQIETRIAAGKVGIEEPKDEPLCGDLMTLWIDGLHNRNAQDDRTRWRRHLLPEFGEMQISQVILSVVMEWIDKQRAAGKLADASIRHNLNLLSRFFSWPSSAVTPRSTPSGRSRPASDPSRAPKRTSPGFAATPSFAC